MAPGHGGGQAVLKLQLPGQMVGHHDGAHHHDEQSGRAEKQADHSKRIFTAIIGSNHSGNFVSGALAGVVIAR